MAVVDICLVRYANTGNILAILDVRQMVAVDIDEDVSLAGSLPYPIHRKIPAMVYRPAMPIINVGIIVMAAAATLVIAAHDIGQPIAVDIDHFIALFKAVVLKIHRSVPRRIVGPARSIAVEGERRGRKRDGAA